MTCLRCDGLMVPKKFEADETHPFTSIEEEAPC
jgi:hypothetical protein